jgi:hypothetical protein
MKTLHTKGNWKTILDPTMCTVTSDVFGGICQIPHMGKHKEEHEANALLIAAAPELLEALKELLECDYTSGTHLYCAQVKAKEAISKATGEPDPYEEIIFRKKDCPF